MPGGNGTGPSGMGSMTGRGAGFCAGFSAPGYANGFAGGCGFGAGRGNRYRRIFYATGLPGWMRYGYGAYPVNPIHGGAGPLQFDEKAYLSKQATALENQLNQVKKRLVELDEKTE